MAILRRNLWFLLGILFFITAAFFLLGESVSSLIIKPEAENSLLYEFLISLSFNLLFCLLLVWYFRKHILRELFQIISKIQDSLGQQESAQSQPKTWRYILPTLYNGVDYLIDQIETKTQLLAETESRYHSILDIQEELVFRVDENGFLTYYNRAFRTFMDMGIHKHQFIDDDFILDDKVSMIIGSGDGDVLKRAQKNVHGHQFSGNFVMNDKTYQLNWIVKHIDATDHDSFRSSFLFVGRDVTQEKIMESRNRQLENLATVGHLAISISHEINQPLSIITMASRNLKDLDEDNLADSEVIQEKTTKIIHQVKRIDKIIRDLKVFSRGQASFKPFNLKTTIISCVNNQIDILSSHDILLTQEMADEEILINGPETLFQQVLHNIIDNAIYALTENNTEQPVIDIACWMKQESSEAMLRITDNGGGAPTEALQKLLQPFYSTKPPGEGSGIGLALCFDVIQKMGGTLEYGNVREGFEILIGIPCSVDVDAPHNQNSAVFD